MILHAPASEAEAADIIRACAADKKTLRIEGGGTRVGLGRPIETDAILSTRALTGVVDYEPSELVIIARAGTTLSEIEAALEKHGHMLPFEPMDHRGLYGSQGEPTIGAIAACGISGPRRIQAGAARDHLLGVRLVNGRGEIVKAGGRVMKNVTGLDLTKLSCGAHGTLGLITEVAFKLRPRAPAAATLAIDGLDDMTGVAALCAGLGSPFEVSGAAHLPAGVAGASSRTLLRLENFPESVAYRCGELARLIASFGVARRLDGVETQSLWRAIRDVEPFWEPRGEVVWRISVAPTRGPEIVAALQRELSFRHYYDWGGGLVWLACKTEKDAGAAAIHKAAAAVRGHAMLMRAPDEMRGRIDVFQPQTDALMKLTRGIKASFDPAGVINPGRVYAGV